METQLNTYTLHSLLQPLKSYTTSQSIFAAAAAVKTYSRTHTNNTYISERVGQESKLFQHTLMEKNIVVRNKMRKRLEAELAVISQPWKSFTEDHFGAAVNQQQLKYFIKFIF